MRAVRNVGWRAPLWEGSQKRYALIPPVEEFPMDVAAILALEETRQSIAKP
jgi:hypothetical protein